MQPGLHAIGWGLQRLAVVAVITAVAIVLAYSALVFVIVAIQAFGAIGQ